jgi:hypothetical protein
LAKDTPFHSLGESDLITKALEMFALGIHRIIIVGADNTLTGVLSQSLVVEYVSVSAHVLSIGTGS